MKKYTAFLLCSFLVWTLSACKKKQDAEEPVGFDLTEVFQGLSEQVFIPNHSSFTEQVSLLKEKVTSFSNEPTSATLEAAQMQWKSSISMWEHCEALKFGKISTSYIHNKIHIWPTNSAFIKGFIFGDDLLNSDFIDSKGSSSKGIPALEYFLFDEAGNNQNVLDSFLLSAYAQRNLDYMVALAENLEKNARKLDDLWSKSYAQEFSGNTATGLLSSESLLLNALTSHIERVLNTKIGKPLGYVGINGLDLSLLESKRSGESLHNIRNNLKLVKACFFGSYSDEGMPGLDDYLAYKIAQNGTQKNVVAEIKAQIETIQKKLDQLPATFSEAVVSNENDLESLYEEWKVLLRLFKVDMANELSVIITVSENDGD